ncbi:hypothetical protein HJC23_004840 [Cyclotella cryptica]|uniref:RING-type E3 ubiquitin transferase n=1 Tax=Cyclotella cryptica TaxID=29204 RepID=A0ABD3P2N5_9STRA
MESDGEDPNAPTTTVESAPKPSDAATKSQDEDDDALAAMMAFQAEQEPVESDDPVHDDPNIVFLQDDNDNDDEYGADELEPDRHPNHDNPAAIALRARLQQHRQGLAAAEQMQNRPLLRRVLSSVFRMRYAPLSFLAAFLLVAHTMRTRQQFYLTVIYLQSSKLSYIVLGNAIIAFGVSTFSVVTKLFLDGGLRVNERDAIAEHIRWDVTETCLALTIFRSEIDVKTAVLFLGLVIMKCLHWSVELRGGHLRMTEEVFVYPDDQNISLSNTNGPNNQNNNRTKKLQWYRRLPHFRLTHLRFYSLLEILILLDIVAVAHCALSVATDGPSVSILFGFEFAILLVSALSAMSMYHLHVVDGIMGFLHHCAEGEHHYNPVGGMADAPDDESQEGRSSEQDSLGEADGRNQENVAPSSVDVNPPRQKTLAKILVERVANPWKNRRATLSFAIELQAQAAKFLFYVVFFAIVFTYYGMPINIFREVYVAFQQLRRRLIAFNNYRRLTHNMEKRFESIKDEEELDRLGHTCIICRDQMDLSGGCKKLPICGHAFHTHCLREWLVQQQSCPTCRADIAANEARRKKQLEREAAEAAASEAEVADTQQTAPESLDGGNELVDAAQSADREHIAGLEEVPETKPNTIQQQQQQKSSFPKEEGQLIANVDETPSTSTKSEADLLIPGWVEEWDPVSNKNYYWNTESGQTTWTRPTLNFPCLYRVTSQIGAPVYVNQSLTSPPKRIIPQGKIVACMSIECWHMPFREFMLSTPDGYIRAADVQMFLSLDSPENMRKHAAMGLAC